jgi:transcriptional regulator with XRE-family HTH domain
MAEKSLVRDPRFKPATKLGDYKTAVLPADYDDTRHGPAPLFVRYEGFAEKLLEAFDMNLTQETAAQFAGTTRNTLIQWLKKGRKAREMVENDPNAYAKLGYWDPYYIALTEAIEAKESSRQIALLKNIQDAGEKKVEGQWQANAWLLERLWPEHYSTKAEIRHAGHDGGPIKHTFSLDQGEGEVEIRTDKEEIERRTQDAMFTILGRDE